MDSLGQGQPGREAKDWISPLDAKARAVATDPTCSQ